MTTFDLETLAQFAAMGAPSSRHETFGNANAAAVTSAITALVCDGYLEALPTAGTCDEFGGTRFRLTAKGRAAAPAPLSTLRRPGKKKGAR